MNVTQGVLRRPVLREIITVEAKRVLGADAAVVDSAEATAGELRDFLAARSLGAAKAGEGTLRMLVTDRPQSFAEVASRFLGHPVDEVEQIDL